MAVVYRCVGFLTVDVVFFWSPGVFHSQDSFPSTFRSRLWETSSGVVAAVARRELWARPPGLNLIYMVHAYSCYVIGQHSDNWNLIGQFLYCCFLWSEVLLCTSLMKDTKFYVFLSLLPSCWNCFYACRFLWLHNATEDNSVAYKNNFNKKEDGLKIHKTWYLALKMCKVKPLITKSSDIETDQSSFSCPSAGQSRSSSTHAPHI